MTTMIDTYLTNAEREVANMLAAVAVRLKATCNSIDHTAPPTDGEDLLLDHGKHVLLLAKSLGLLGADGALQIGLSVDWLARRQQGVPTGAAPQTCKG
jgi:hypothetical protein